MIYNDFCGMQVSALGFGAMRLPVVDDNASAIDEAAVSEMVAYAIEHGVNYFDTAWGYHNGQSELVMGRTLAAYSRDSFMLATKFPGYDRSNFGKHQAIFEEQLKKCQVEYFDFYLLHNVNESNIDKYLELSDDIIAYFEAQKAAGTIRHLGFSAHGTLDVIKRFMDAYGAHMEFCQLQINWLDWDFQDARSKVAYFEGLGIPVIVMEPLRGGSLANLAPEDAAILEALHPDEAPVAWSFRFCQGIPGVLTTLSGMSNLDQLKANIATYQTAAPLTPEENAVLLEIARTMTARKTLPCTSCRYCTEYCPMELDIPRLINLFNEFSYTGGGFIPQMVVGTLPADKKPSACIGCGACEAVCPQNIGISKAMDDFAKGLKLR